MRNGSPPGSLSTLPSRLQPAACSSLNACPSSARSCPEPSDFGGITASPNTASEILPRNGSSSASSSGPGLPVAAIGEFWK